jgi:hypothetical protein
MISYKYASGCFFALLGFLIVSPLAHAQQPQQKSQKPMVYEDTAGGVRYLEQGQPPVIIHATVDNMRRFREAHPNAGHAHGGGPPHQTSNNLDYHGGTGGIGVETGPTIYLVFWGSQWNNNDPSGEAALLENFYGGVGGSSWLNSVTQYCQGVASGTVFCTGANTGTPAGDSVKFVYWYDTSSAAPSNPKQSQFAAEAVNAASHFGITDNASVQYVIATAHGYNASGFGRQYCAYHSSTSSSYGNIAYTNLPYITDAGANCGANFNGLGADAGITIVSGHEMAETITDQFPSTGWLDGNGEENGDKCAWISSGQGASANIKFSTGTFAVQSLWSNAFNNDSGGCVLSY